MNITIDGITETFELMDKIVEKYPFEVVVAVTEDIYKNAKETIRPHTLNHTGSGGSRLENNLNFRVHSKPSPNGEVFIDDAGMLVQHKHRSVNYAMFVHFGTKPHIIEPNKKKALRWAGANGFVFAKKVKHKGYKGDPFMTKASQQTFKKLDQIFTKVYDGIQ